MTNLLHTFLNSVHAKESSGAQDYNGDSIGTASNKPLKIWYDAETDKNKLIKYLDQMAYTHVYPKFLKFQNYCFQFLEVFRWLAWYQ